MLCPRRSDRRDHVEGAVGESPHPRVHAVENDVPEEDSAREPAAEVDVRVGARAGRDGWAPVRRREDEVVRDEMQAREVERELDPAEQEVEPCLASDDAVDDTRNDGHEQGAQRAGEDRSHHQRRDEEDAALPPEPLEDAHGRGSAGASSVRKRPAAEPRASTGPNGS